MGLLSFLILFVTKATLSVWLETEQWLPNRQGAVFVEDETDSVGTR